jgi:hypothetical protein
MARGSGKPRGWWTEPTTMGPMDLPAPLPRSPDCPTLYLSEWGTQGPNLIPHERTWDHVRSVEARFELRSCTVDKQE